MFRGTSAINLDAKGRLAMPSRYRQELEDLCAGHLVITVDVYDSCLCIYPLCEWERVEAQLSRLPTSHPQARRYKRVLIGNAEDLELDGNGRILVPQRLREYAGLGKHVMLVGQLHKFQLWDEQKWSSLLDEDLGVIQQAEELPEDLMNLVL